MNGDASLFDLDQIGLDESVVKRLEEREHSIFERGVGEAFLSTLYRFEERWPSLAGEELEVVSVVFLSL